MATDDDLSVSLPKPPPPRPARRDAAIEAALRRFDGISDDVTAAADRPRAASPGLRTRLRQPQMGVLVSAAIVAAIGLPAALIAIRDLSPRASEEAVAPRASPTAQMTSPPPARDSQPNSRRDPTLQDFPAAREPPPTASTNESPATPARPEAGGEPVSGPDAAAAAAEPAVPFAGYVSAPPPPAPPPPPPPTPQAAPMVAERSTETVTNDVVVTGSRTPQSSIASNRSSKASERGRADAAEQIARSEAADSAYATFLARLQSAIRTNDRRTTIRLIAFPLRVNSSGRTRLYPDARSVERNFDQIFTPRVKQAILRQRSDRLFNRDQGAMIGDGEVWFDHTCRNSTCSPLGPVRIKAVNH